MKLKLLLLLVIVLCMTSSTHAVPYTIMNEKLISKVRCEYIFSQIPDKYFEGIRMINIYPQGTSLYYDGMYYPGGVINLYDGCVFDTIAHELAHHQQWLNHLVLNIVTAHDDKFEHYRHMIINEVFINETH